MPKKQSEKNISNLEASFRDILVCENESLKPFIEIFVQEPENVSEASLGTLAGIFEIMDDSEDSSYVVNYLISVIKKEYYSKTKRGAVESLEAALHKTNLALAKLAEHGSVGWLGNINAVIGVIEKNNIHLSQTGSAKALLLRGKTLMNITEGSEKIETPNPLKTFTDVLSGRLEEEDRLILTTESMFEIFSFEEIKRSAIKFSPEEFFRFLRTALVNELSRAAVLVANVAQQKENEAAQEAKKPVKLNAFSQQAFARPAVKKPAIVKDNPDQSGLSLKNEEESLVSEIEEELEKESAEFVDKKTGHIYIKEDRDIPLENESFWTEFRENLSETADRLAKKTLAGFDAAVQKLKNLNWSGLISFLRRKNCTKTISVEVERPAEKSSRDGGILSVWRKKATAAEKFIAPTLSKSRFFLENIWHSVSNQAVRLSQIFFRFLFVQAYKIRSFWRSKTAARKNKEDFRAGENIAKKLGGKSLEEFSGEENTGRSVAATVIGSTPKAKSVPFEKNPKKIVSKILPDFGRLGRLLSNFDYSQKLYAVLILLLLLVVPFFIAKRQNRSESTETTQSAPPEQTVATPLNQDKNVLRIDALDTYSSENAADLADLNGKIFAISEKKITDVENKKDYPFPDGFGSFKEAFGMDDLNLLFIIDKENKVISWSPVAEKYTDNLWDLSSDTPINAAKSYLTYAYILDSSAGQIYRYPRAQGGFGEKTDWLKDGSDLNGAKDMAVSDNIFIAFSDRISKFFQGKKQAFEMEQSTTAISIDKIYTRENFKYVYVLDKTNSRIVKFDPDGRLVSQYYNPDISNAENFAIDETLGKIYMAGRFGIEGFGLN